MAPGGERLPLAAVTDAVVQWFTEDTPMPPEWDGKGLQELVRDTCHMQGGSLDSDLLSELLSNPSLLLSQTTQEQQILKEYSDKHCRLTVFSDVKRIDSILQQIETTLRNRT